MSAVLEFESGELVEEGNKRTAFAGRAFTDLFDVEGKSWQTQSAPT